MPAEPQSSFDRISNYDVFLDKAKKDFDRKFNKKGSDGLTLNDFSIMRTLGTGSFGRVVLVKHKITNSFYAIKILTKAKIVKQKQVEHTLNEKKILQSIRFPFIIYMDFSFMDNSYVYFVLPFIAGGEMFSYLRKVKKFDEPQAKFYGAQVVLALEFLHSLDIVYRDLKPENILIDINGYLKVTDLGFCKIVKGRTYTLCGTPDYIAPEILLSKGYGKSVDWWSFGVLLFEMVAGFAPFSARDPMKTYEKIVVGKYSTPPHFSNEMKDLIRNILQVDTSKRFGNLKEGVNGIKNHKWFAQIEWMAILNKQVTPKYIPKYKGGGDTSNFDQYEEVQLKVDSDDKYANEFAAF